MDNRKSDMLIVPEKLLITVEGRGVHFIAPSKSESCRQRRADISWYVVVKHFCNTYG